MNLEREKKKKQLAEAMKEAGAGQGIKGAISEETVDKVKSTIGNLKNNLSEARTGGLSEKVQSLKDVEEKVLKKKK